MSTPSKLIPAPAASQPRVTLGIDPAIATTGYSVFRGTRLIEYGKITTPASAPEALRYSTIFSEINEVLIEYEVTDVAIEKFVAFYGTDSPGESNRLLKLVPAGEAKSLTKKRSQYDGPNNPRSLYLMKGAQAVILLAAQNHCGGAYQYTLQEWKGNAKRTKAQVREQANLAYGLNVKDHNVTDAIMIGAYHVHQGVHLAAARGAFSGNGIGGTRPGLNLRRR